MGRKWSFGDENNVEKDIEVTNTSRKGSFIDEPPAKTDQSRKGSGIIEEKLAKTFGKPASDSFEEIEKESQEIVDKLETSMKSTPDIKEMNIQPGLLKVIIFEASNLYKSDVIGKSDPYVIVKFQNQEYRSKTVDNTLNPEWNFTANLCITSEDKGDIVIEVYDDDKFKTDEQLGSINIPIKEAKVNKEKEEWANLHNGRGGKILFSVIYMPTDG